MRVIVYDSLLIKHDCLTTLFVVWHIAIDTLGRWWSGIHADGVKADGHADGTDRSRDRFMQ